MPVTELYAQQKVAQESTSAASNVPVLQTANVQMQTSVEEKDWFEYVTDTISAALLR